MKILILEFGRAHKAIIGGKTDPRINCLWPKEYGNMRYGPSLWRLIGSATTGCTKYTGHT